MTLQYWYMFPVSVIFAVIAMASGVGGATFFAPFFILVLGLPVEVAVGTGLITELFGFSSGLISYARQRLIDYRLGIALLMVTVPMAILGTLMVGLFDSEILKTVLGVGLMGVALSFIKAPDEKDVSKLDLAIHHDFGGEKAKTVIKTAKGEEIRYTVCNKNEGRLIAGIGGLFVGLISTGLGELNGFFLMQRCRVPSKVSVATSVFVVALTVLSASTGHFIRFLHSGGDVLPKVLSIVLFTIPGVVIGGQIGSRLASRIPQRLLERSLGVLFIIIAVLTLGEVVF
jgi:uncharacterized membrane protein YfcA